MSEAAIQEGGRVRVPLMHQEGYVDEVDDRRATVILDNGESVVFATDSEQLVAAPFAPGDRVVRVDGTEGIVIRRVSRGGKPFVEASFFDGQRTNTPERALRPAEISDPLARFEAGRVDSADEFNLRSVAADLWIRHRAEQFVSLAHAQFDLMPHQVGVLYRVMSRSPHRFLLCDEVGLGKTIEAAMVIKELISRGLAERILILTPASIQRQWQYELKTKFNETFRVFNRDTLRYLRSDINGNPWTSKESTRVITSHNFAAHNEQRRKEIASAPWDLIIVDEAHHARRRRQGNRVEQTNLYRLVRDLTAESGLDQRAVLFLTATPMQLQHHELFSLVELLDHKLFPSEDDFIEHVNARAALTRLVSEIEEQVHSDSELPHYVERAQSWLVHDPNPDEQIESMSELLARLRRSHRLNEVLLRNRRAAVGGFMPRTAKEWSVKLSGQEETAQAAMESIISDGYRVAAQGQDRRANAIGFLMTIYQRLAASSSRALLDSLERRRARLLESEDGIGNADNEGLVGVDEAADELEDDRAAGGVVPRVDATISHEADRIGDVIDLLRRIELDSKARVLRDGMRILNQQDENAKVIIFTEFRETQAMLRELLVGEGWGCEVFHGQLDARQKDEAVARFRDRGGPQVLVSTEAGGEGRNLQFANILVNYDLPWNPMKVEQRIGRVDRIGQQNPILIFNFRVEGTIEERVLEVLDKRIGLFESAIGGLEPILGDAENDIRNAMREAADRRDAALLKVGQRLQRDIEAAKLADRELGSLFMDASAYQNEIKRLIGEAQREPFPQATVDELLVRLLRSVNASVTPPGDGGRFPVGQRRIEFLPPFSSEERALLDGSEVRRVCFDPRLTVESSDIEYFGFGHPIVNALIDRVTRQRDEGKAAVRYISRANYPTVRPGWQFNWRLRMHAADSREWLLPVFVDNDLQLDQREGSRLAVLSRRFLPESAPDDRLPQHDTTGLAEAHEVAEQFAIECADRLEASRRERAIADYERTHARLVRLYDIRLDNAEKRRRSDQQILDRIRRSTDPIQRQVIPIWDFNVRKSTDHIAHLQEQRERELEALAKTRDPNVEYELHSVARIEVAR